MLRKFRAVWNPRIYHGFSRTRRFFEGRIYRFTTSTGAEVRDLRVDAEKIHIGLEDSRFCLEVEADRQDGADLASPTFGAMTSKVNLKVAAEMPALNSSAISRSSSTDSKSPAKRK